MPPLPPVRREPQHLLDMQPQARHPSPPRQVRQALRKERVMTAPAEDPIRALYRKTQEAKKTSNVHPFLFGVPALTEQATATTDDEQPDNLPPAA